MKGMVGLCYDMLRWEAYMETRDVVLNEVQRIQLKNEIHDFLSDAILELVEENKKSFLIRISALFWKRSYCLKQKSLFSRINPVVGIVGKDSGKAVEVLKS